MRQPVPALRAVVTGVAVVVGVTVALAGCVGTPGGGRAGVVEVVAGENFWGGIAAQLGGDHVSVRSILTDPSADPHEYESDAGDAEAVARARVVIENGLGYDDFVSKLLSVTRNRGRVVLSVADVLHVHGADANPHLWYAIERVPEAARAIEAALANADPGDAQVFAANLAKFDTSLEPLDRLLREIRTTYRGAPVAYTERVPEYLLKEAGLTDLTPPGFARSIEDGNEPGARDRRAMDDLVSTRRVRVVLENAQATSPVTRDIADLARRHGVPLIAVTETQPLGAASYQSWQEQQLRSLLQALAA